MELAGQLDVAVVVKPVKVKPRLRGTFHFFGFFASLFGVAEMGIAPVEGWRYAAGLIFAGSLALMLGLSALYHRPNWSRAARNRLRMADHVGIFFLIAGSYTPFAAFLSPHTWTPGLVGMWIGAAAGITYALVNSHGNRVIRAATYVVLGLCAAPMILGLPKDIGWGKTLVMLAGAAIYILGAGVYAKRWPNPKPSFFGYHEIFHIMVLIAAGMHFSVVWSLQQS
jgi:hemolysin III